MPHCPVCNKEFHACSNCCLDYSWEYIYCSSRCWKMSAEYKQIEEKLTLFVYSLKSYQRECMIWMLDEMSDDYRPILRELLKTPEELESERQERIARKKKEEEESEARKKAAEESLIKSELKMLEHLKNKYEMKT